MCSSSHIQGLEKEERGGEGNSAYKCIQYFGGDREETKKTSNVILVPFTPGANPFSLEGEENGFKHSQKHWRYSFRECLFRKTNPDRILVPRQSQSWKGEPFPAAVSSLQGFSTQELPSFCLPMGFHERKKAGIFE